MPITSCAGYRIAKFACSRTRCLTWSPARCWQPARAVARGLTTCLRCTGRAPPRAALPRPKPARRPSTAFDVYLVVHLRAAERAAERLAGVVRGVHVEVRALDAAFHEEPL